MSDSEEEYGPICATWGAQAPATTDPTDAWKTLIDPNVQVGPNELGSGNLHRRGHNFKPIDEEIILAQRNKVQISKKKMKEAIKQSGAALGLPTSPPPQHHKKKSNSTSTRTTTTTTTNRKHVADIPTLSTLRPPPQKNSLWSTSNLVETPFWEAQKPATSTSTTTTTKTNLGTPINESQIANEWGQSVNTNWGATEQQKGWEEFDKKQNTPAVQQQHSWGPIDDKPVVQKQATNGWGNTEKKQVTSPTPKKEVVSSGWGNVDKSPKKDTASNGWGNVDKPPKKEDTSGWGNVDKEPKKEDTSGWGEVDTAKKETTTGWGQTDTKNDTSGWASVDKEPKKSTSNDTSGWSNWSSDQILDNKPTPPPVSDKPSWLGSPTQQHSPQPPSSRFSIANKGRYTPTIDVPEPVNYKRNGKPVIPTATAPPPPPENRHLITINVELSTDSKISVMIRELDDPHALAENFAKNHNISSDKVVQALTALFSTQKDQALKMRNKRLQRRVPKPVHNNNFDYSAYEASPVYQRSEPTRYSRKSFY